MAILAGGAKTTNQSADAATIPMRALEAATTELREMFLADQARESGQRQQTADLIKQLRSDYQPEINALNELVRTRGLGTYDLVRLRTADAIPEHAAVLTVTVQHSGGRSVGKGGGGSTWDKPLSTCYLLDQLPDSRLAFVLQQPVEILKEAGFDPQIECVSRQNYHSRQSVTKLEVGDPLPASGKQAE